MFQTFTGKEYLKIDIANNYGLDKLSWDDRITWFDLHEQSLETLLNQAAEPALYYAGVKAWREVQQGLPIGYMISLDATSSGLQILAALTGDRSAAQLCNVVDTGQREDAYTAIYQAMVLQIQDTAKISRDDVKKAIMTSLYSSTAVPKRVFGEGALLSTFYDTMKFYAPAAWELNETMLALWNPDALAHSWVLPDNFHAYIKVMDTVVDIAHFDNKPYDITYKVNRPMPEGRSLGANMVHSIDGLMVREITRRCDYDQAKVDRIADAMEGYTGTWTSKPDDKMVQILWTHYLETGFLSARILDHLNEDNLGLADHAIIRQLLKSLPAKPFKVISVHDCFRCLPHYGNDLRRQYNLQLKMIAESDLLSSLISQIIGRQVTIGKLDPTLYRDIMETNYALS